MLKNSPPQAIADLNSKAWNSVGHSMATVATHLENLEISGILHFPKKCQGNVWEFALKFKGKVWEIIDIDLPKSLTDPKLLKTLLF